MQTVFTILGWWWDDLHSQVGLLSYCSTDLISEMELKLGLQLDTSKMYRALTSPK